MANPIKILRSPLTNRIYAGRAAPVKGMAPGVVKITGDKFDVTDDTLYAVVHYLVKTNDIKVFRQADGTEIHLRADIIPARSDE